MKNLFQFALAALMMFAFYSPPNLNADVPVNEKIVLSDQVFVQPDISSIAVDSFAHSYELDAVVLYNLPFVCSEVWAELRPGLGIHSSYAEHSERQCSPFLYDRHNPGLRYDPEAFNQWPCDYQNSKRYIRKDYCYMRLQGLYSHRYSKVPPGSSSGGLSRLLETYSHSSRHIS